MAGDVKVVASSNLKGLGATDGPPVVYHWTPPNPFPRLLPWLATLVLLLLKPNRIVSTGGSGCHWLS